MYNSRIAVNCSVPAVSSLFVSINVLGAVAYEHLHFEHDRSTWQERQCVLLFQIKTSLTIHVEHLSVRIFDGRIITLNPDILHELSCQAAFAVSAVSIRDFDVSLSSYPTPPTTTVSTALKSTSEGHSYLRPERQCLTLSCQWSVVSTLKRPEERAHKLILRCHPTTQKIYRSAEMLSMALPPTLILPTFQSNPNNETPDQSEIIASDPESNELRNDMENLTGWL